jgi:hypothetical protein
MQPQRGGFSFLAPPLFLHLDDFSFLAMRYKAQSFPLGKALSLISHCRKEKAPRLLFFYCTSSNTFQRGFRCIRIRLLLFSAMRYEASPCTDILGEDLCCANTRGCSTSMEIFRCLFFSECRHFQYLHSRKEKSSDSYAQNRHSKGKALSLISHCNKRKVIGFLCTKSFQRGSLISHCRKERGCCGGGGGTIKEKALHIYLPLGGK